MAAVLPSAPVEGLTVPGLERLIQLAMINVKQTSSGNNGHKYTVFSQDQPLFILHEGLPDTVARVGFPRPFVFEGVDNSGKRVFQFGRALYSDSVELFINDQLASTIRMEKTYVKHIFTICDPQKLPVLRLKGKISETTDFELQTATKINIGRVFKKWRGLQEELFTYNDNFILNFPVDLAPQYKLAVIVTCVYYDLKFYESQ